MLILDKIVQVLNRKWQREFEALAKSLEDLPDVKPIPRIDVNSVVQPTHLSHRGTRRVKRRRTYGTGTNPLTKEESLNQLMKQELLKLAR